ncbi:MAG TPA: hypothetical protein VJC39_02900 [Candidatus Nanoarchaeia archaeon]|nr:hypothetical protein [Candidatus Nanoarchaeia archaeon]
MNDKLDTIKRNQHIIYNNLPDWITYIAIGIAAIAGIKSCSRTQEILDSYQKAPQVQIENVISQEAPERFYYFNGQRVYLEIDGKPVEQYVQER